MTLGKIAQALPLVQAQLYHSNLTEIKLVLNLSVFPLYPT